MEHEPTKRLQAPQWHDTLLLFSSANTRGSSAWVEKPTGLGSLATQTALACEPMQWAQNPKLGLPKLTKPTEKSITKKPLSATKPEKLADLPVSVPSWKGGVLRSLNTKLSTWKRIMHSRAWLDVGWQVHAHSKPHLSPAQLSWKTLALLLASPPGEEIYNSYLLSERHSSSSNKHKTQACQTDS